jgi:hypothetical protein
MMPLRPFFCWALIFMALLIATNFPLQPAQADDGQLEVTLVAGDYHIDQQHDGSHRVQMQGFGALLIPGKPKLPARVFSIALPPGARVTSVTFQPDPPVPIPGTYHIAPVPPTLPLIKDEQLEAL